ncbi:MAG: succinate CoA transferase [Deltaproteobacteria bacterium]|nr:succinate CoA transferase [Deltaproteobacteria bacterium]
MINGSSILPKLSPAEAAAQIRHGMTVAFSGFAQAGAAKAVPRAIAAMAREKHEKGESYKLRVLSGASAGPFVDVEMAEAEAICWRAPYMSSHSLRRQINRQEVEYLDMHLSHAPQTLGAGFFGKLDYAVVEATGITRDGRVYLTSSVGSSPTFLKYADRVIIEINEYHSKRLPELSDITLLPLPPRQTPIPIHDPLTRVGYPYAVVDPRKVVGIVETEEPDKIDPPTPPDRNAQKIAEHVVQFLFGEMIRGNIPREFLPIQSGVGNLANGVMGALGRNPYIPPFKMYTVAVQDSLVDLMEQEKLLGMSATSLSVSPATLKRIYENMDFFAPRIVLRPQEISNDAGVVRRLGVIAINAAVEVDIYGNVNSSHVYGTDIINGIGGSGEFTRNSFLSIIMCPSIGRGGRISSVVPMCPHIDSNEHSVQILVTEQGLADLRGLGPMQRAKRIINNCAHPAYRDYLQGYIRDARVGHIRHDLRKAFQLHRNLMEHGSMLPDLNLSEIHEIR